MITNEDRDRMRVNSRYWNDAVAVHRASAFYDVAGFKTGAVKLNALERGEVGDVSGKSLLHLQCHFGMDTLSWARLGASVTGMDYSEQAIRAAGELAAECGLEGRFICCNLYDLPAHLDGQFDIVYTSYGVLCWLPDLREWARIAASYVKPGGFFYIAEFHPFAYVFDDEADHLKFRYPYFNEDALKFEFDGSYVEGSADLMKGYEDFEWTYRLGDVVSALIDAGLRIEFLREHPYTVYQQLPFLVRDDQGNYVFPGGAQPIPLMFSLKASKP